MTLFQKFYRLILITTNKKKLSRKRRQVYKTSSFNPRMNKYQQYIRTTLVIEYINTLHGEI